MTTLVVGAMGATGQLLVAQLLNRGQKINVIVREQSGLLDEVLNHENISIILRTEIGQNSSSIKWSVVRPDRLTNESKVTQFDVHASPIRSVIYDAGSTSRINVGHFMAELITNQTIWKKWQGEMPVVYNRSCA